MQTLVKGHRKSEGEFPDATNAKLATPATPVPPAARHHRARPHPRGGGALKSAHAEYLPVSVPQSLNTVKAKVTQSLANNVVTTDPTSKTNDSAEATFQWYWNGVGSAPSQIFEADFTISNGGMAISNSAGVYTSASRDLRAGLYNPSTEDALPGNPPPYSDFIWISVGPGEKIRVATTTPVTLTTTLQPPPPGYYNPQIIQVKLKSQATALTNISNYGADSTANANSGPHEVTLTRSLLIYTP